MGRTEIFQNSNYRRQTYHKVFISFLYILWWKTLKGEQRGTAIIWAFLFPSNDVPVVHLSSASRQSGCGRWKKTNWGMSDRGQNAKKQQDMAGCAICDWNSVQIHKMNLGFKLLPSHPPCPPWSLTAQLRSWFQVRFTNIPSPSLAE